MLFAIPMVGLDQVSFGFWTTASEVRGVTSLYEVKLRANNTYECNCGQT